MHFVLDQNFPFQATGLPWPRGVEVSALRVIAPELTRDHDDWEIFRALQRRGDVDGFITNDSSLLHLPREMVMLSHTRLTLVVIDGLGHDPLGATGLLMLQLPQIAKQSHPVPRIYVLKRPGLHLTRLRPQIDSLAAREGIPGSALMSRELAEIARIP
jgi:hypothetical protein